MVAAPFRVQHRFDSKFVSLMAIIFYATDHYVEWIRQNWLNIWGSEQLSGTRIKTNPTHNNGTPVEKWKRLLTNHIHEINAFSISLAQEKRKTDQQTFASYSQDTVNTPQFEYIFSLESLCISFVQLFTLNGKSIIFAGDSVLWILRP